MAKQKIGRGKDRGFYVLPGKWQLALAMGVVDPKVQPEIPQGAIVHHHKVRTALGAERTMMSVSGAANHHVTPTPDTYLGARQRHINASCATRNLKKG